MCLSEDYQMVLQWGGKCRLQSYVVPPNSCIDVPELPARILYEDVLPSLVSALSTTSPTTPYHRGSPYGGEGWDTADPTVGDVHQWEIWGGKEKPWQDYWRMGGRFVRYATLSHFLTPWIRDAHPISNRTQPYVDVQTPSMPTANLSSAQSGLTHCPKRVLRASSECCRQG